MEFEIVPWMNFSGVWRLDTCLGYLLVFLSKEVSMHVAWFIIFVFPAERKKRSYENILIIRFQIEVPIFRWYRTEQVSHKKKWSNRQTHCLPWFWENSEFTTLRIRGGGMARRIKI
jgi:hypothetical protein